MSLPIPNLALVHGATQIATQVAGRVGKAMGFDEVLRGGDAVAASSAQQAVPAQQVSDAKNTDVAPKIDDLHDPDQQSDSQSDERSGYGRERCIANSS